MNSEDRIWKACHSDLLDAVYDSASPLEYEVWSGIRVEISKSIDHSIEAIVKNKTKEYEFARQKPHKS